MLVKLKVKALPSVLMHGFSLWQITFGAHTQNQYLVHSARNIAILIASSVSHLLLLVYKPSILIHHPPCIVMHGKGRDGHTWHAHAKLSFHKQNHIDPEITSKSRSWHPFETKLECTCFWHLNCLAYTMYPGYSRRITCVEHVGM